MGLARAKAALHCRITAGGKIRRKQRTNPITSANNNFKQSSRNRFLVAVAITGVCLLLLVLFGPSSEEINKKFEYPGAKREMTIMETISVIDGKDKMHQMPKSLQTPPPPSVVEIEEEVIHEDGLREVVQTKPDQMVENPVVEVITPDKTEEFSRELVSMATPMPSSRNYFVKNMALPEYPLGATEAERNTPVIFVNVEFFFDHNGIVTATLIKSTNGGRAFTEEVLKKMDQWIIGYYIDPGAGMWMETTWNFKSPYFTHSQNQGG